MIGEGVGCAGVPGGGAAVWGGAAIGVGAGAPRTCIGGGTGGAVWACGAGCSNGGICMGCMRKGGCAAGDPVGTAGEPAADAPRSSWPEVIIVVPAGAGGTPPALDRTLPC